MIMTSKEALDKLNKHFHLDCYSFNDNENSKIREYEIIKQDLEILELIKKHLYVANGLVEMKITSEEYEKMHKVKFHNGIPIANQEAIDKINKWFWRDFNDE